MDLEDRVERERQRAVARSAGLESERAEARERERGVLIRAERGGRRLCVARAAGTADAAYSGRKRRHRRAAAATRAALILRWFAERERLEIHARGLFGGATQRGLPVRFWCDHHSAWRHRTEWAGITPDEAEGDAGQSVNAGLAANFRTVQSRPHQPPRLLVMSDLVVSALRANCPRTGRPAYRTDAVPTPPPV